MAKVVEFYLINTGPCTPGSGASKKQIGSFEDLINYTNSYSSSVPYTIELKCVVKTYDENKFVGRHTFGQTRTYKNHPIINQETVDTYKIYVGDKLICVDDIVKFVNEQYSMKAFQKSFVEETYNLDLDLCFDDKGKPVNKDKPVVLDKIQFTYKNAPKKDGVLDPQEKDLELVRVPLIQWHYLTEKDIFVDRKTLRRITEDGTIGEVIVVLKEFFTKTR